MCLKIPGKDPDFDLVAFMDVERNPGPPEVEISRFSLTFHLQPLIVFTYVVLFTLNSPLTTAVYDIQSA